MKGPLFRTKTFPIENSVKCACLVTGYRGRISSYSKVIEVLKNKGYTVIAYEHNSSVLTDGDPHNLLALVDQICKDFAKRSARFNEAICVVASVGAGICFAIQKQVPNIKYGIYASAGVSPPDNVFEAPLFYFVRRKFTKSGFSASRLKKIWQDIDILPSKLFSQTPFVMALGKRDKIVKYDKSLSTLHAWQCTGQLIKIISKDRLGHFGIIRWYKQHIEELIGEAESLIA